MSVGTHHTVGHTAVKNEATAAYEIEGTPGRKIISHPSSW
jgi:hypothetical protein